MDQFLDLNIFTEIITDFASGKKLHYKDNLAYAYRGELPSTIDAETT